MTGPDAKSVGQVRRIRSNDIKNLCAVTFRQAKQLVENFVSKINSWASNRGRMKKKWEWQWQVEEAADNWQIVGVASV